MTEALRRKGEPKISMMISIANTLKPSPTSAAGRKAAGIQKEAL